MKLTNSTQISESSVSKLIGEDTQAIEFETLKKELKALEEKAEIQKSLRFTKAVEFQKVRQNFEMAVKNAPTILKLKAISEACSSLASLTSKLTASLTGKGPEINDHEMTDTVQAIWNDMIAGYTWVNKNEAYSLIKQGEEMQEAFESYKQSMVE